MRFSLAATALAVAASQSVFAGPGLSPASVSKKEDPGKSFSVKKVVTTPEIPPKPDVVLLVDVTGSMGVSINDIKANLGTVITKITDSDKNAQMAVVSFGDFRESNAFKVVQDLTDSKADLLKAVATLKAEKGLDDEEDWINGLFQVANGAIHFRSGSSRIVVLISDQPSHDPSGGHTEIATIQALLGPPVIRVVAVNVKHKSGAGGLIDRDGQASRITGATGGVIIGSSADEVTKAIVSGLHNLDVLVKPVASCASGLAVDLTPHQTLVSSGATVTFQETITVATNAPQGKQLECKVDFLLNGTPGGSAFVQGVTVDVQQVGCFTCDPAPDKNKCHITTTCTGTPFGTMCLTRPGYKADGVKDDDTKVQWRIEWDVGGHEHRVAVKPGTPANTLCKAENVGPDVCKEVALAECKKAKGAGTPPLGGTEQVVIGGGEL